MAVLVLPARRCIVFVVIRGLTTIIDILSAKLRDELDQAAQTTEAAGPGQGVGLSAARVTASEDFIRRRRDLALLPRGLPMHHDTDWQK